MKLLYYAPFSRGGIAEYSHCQADALARLGVDVTLMCSAHDEGPWHRIRALPYALRPVLHGWRVRGRSAPVRKALFTRDLLADASTLAAVTQRDGFPRVLFAAYNENFAPLWAGPLRRLKEREGTVFGAIVHDPTRGHRLGPRWWHQASVAAAYSVLREAFVHAPVTLSTARPMPALRTTVIPHGPYAVPPPQTDPAKWRAAHGLPSDARVLLSFGYLRDDKNLELALRALPRFPRLHLVVAGSEQSGGQRGPNFYRKLAGELGVDDRCHWLIRFIPAEESGDIFQASDLLLLTYSRGFRSASGVLNIAANFRIPCLASGGESNLRGVVQEYGLGRWIEPDSQEALVDGIEDWLRGAMPTPRWTEYSTNHSWRRNAEIVATQMDVLAVDKGPKGNEIRLDTSWPNR